MGCFRIRTNRFIRGSGMVGRTPKEDARIGATWSSSGATPYCFYGAVWTLQVGRRWVGMTVRFKRFWRIRPVTEADWAKYRG